MERENNHGITHASRFEIKELSIRVTGHEFDARFSVFFATSKN